MTEEHDELTAEEMEEVKRWVGAQSPTPDINYNIHKFFHDVAVSDDTTKTGYITDDELGTPKLPVRTYKELAIFCDKIWEQPEFKEYFEGMSEIITSTSLSKDAKFLELAIATRREVADVTKKPQKKKGWFGRKDKGG